MKTLQELLRRMKEGLSENAKGLKKALQDVHDKKDYRALQQGEALN